MKIINQERELSKEDLDKINSHYEFVKSDDNRVYGSLEKMALKISMDFLEGKKYKISPSEFIKNKKNVIYVLDKNKNKKVSVKVLASGIGLPGKTKRVNSKEEVKFFPSQRYYLIDKSESFSDQYILVDRDLTFNDGYSNLRFNVFSIIPGGEIEKYLFHSIIGRFSDTKYCILKKEAYNKFKDDLTFN